MQSIKNKFSILITVLLCSLLISTCVTIKETVNIRCMEKQHEASISYLKKEKAAQQATYEKRIAVLVFQKEYWKKSFYESQHILATKKDSIAVLAKELKTVKIKALRSRKFAGKLGDALAGCLTLQKAQEKSCNEKIMYLEQFAAKRNTSGIYRSSFYKRNHVFKEKMQRIKYMTGKLNTIFQLQRYKFKQKIAIKQLSIGIASPMAK